MQEDIDMSDDDGDDFEAQYDIESDPPSEAEAMDDGDDEYDSDDNWFEDSEGRSIIVPQVKPKWKPFLHWFEALKAQCWMENDSNDSYPVRIGREMDDLWIEIDPISTMGTSAREKKNHYRYVHEALLMMTLLARVDHPSWIGALVRHAKFQVPKYLDFQISAQLPPKFTFFLPVDFAPREYDWDHLQPLFGSDVQFSERFQSQYKQVCTMAMDGLDDEQARALRVSLAQPIPIKLRVAPNLSTVAKQVMALQSLLQTLQGMRRSDSTANPTDLVLPTLSLDVLELNAGECKIHPTVYKALQRVVETGVRIKPITLPLSGPLDGWEDKAIRLAWSSLITTMLGLRRSTNSAAVRVESMSVGQWYSCSMLLDALRSALCKTKVLKSFTCDVGLLINGSDEPQRLWGWLCYALFSKVSNNSVDTIHFDWFQLTDDLMGQMREMAANDDPLGLLRRWIAPSHEQAQGAPAYMTVRSHQIVRVEAGAVFSIYSYPDTSVEMSDKTSRLAIVVQDIAGDPTIDVMMTGFGLCKVDRVSVSPVGKTTGDVSANRPLQSFVFSSLREEPGVSAEPAVQHRLQMTAAPFVAPFLETVGGSITSLALEAMDLTEESVARVFRLCPRLENLRLRGATLPSMEVFSSEYETNPAFKLSSLELRDLTVPIASFETFLGLLESDDHPIVRKLHRLRIGQGWSRTIGESTEQAMEQMLYSNRFITHFHLYTRSNAELTRWDPDEAGCNGDVVAAGPFPVSGRLAFLSAVKTSSMMTSSTVPKALGLLTPDLSAQIFDFAMRTTWRRAYAEPDIERMGDW